MLVPVHIVDEPDIAATEGTAFTVTAVVTPVAEPHTLVAVIVYTPALNVETPNDAGF